MTGYRFSQSAPAANDALRSKATAAPSKIRHIHWMGGFETGNREIDAWHRKLVEQCNRLLELAASGAARPQIVAAAEEFVAVCAEHFRVEEDILERLDFPRRHIHAAEHRRCESELLALIWRLRDSDAPHEQCRDLPLWLAPALIDLFVRYDTDFRSHLLERQDR